ncbi:MAG: DUF2071 domain-containing protein [Planctomycetales bacterium]
MRKNPLTMWGRIDRCWLFTFQTPPEEVASLLPAGMELMIHNGKAFWNAVVCRVGAMRPKPLPSLVGVSYWHVAYRLYASVRPTVGEPIPGLYFLRSDCDSRLMAWAGNLMTDFHFHAAGIKVHETERRVEISIDVPGGSASVIVDRSESPVLPEGSAFGSLEEAKETLKYHPAGLSAGGEGRANVVHITRDESKWNARLATVAESRWEFLEDKNVRPEICYDVDPIVYQWNRGRLYDV